MDVTRDSVAAPRRRTFLVPLGIVALALGLRLVHVLEWGATEFFDERSLISDTRYYDQRADEIARRDFVGSTPGFLSPLYCYALAAVYILPWNDMATAKLVQVLLGAATVFLVYRIGRWTFSDATGVLAGVLAATYGVFIFYTGLLFPTTLLLFLHVLAVALLIGGRAGPVRLGAAGLCIGLAVAVKANALLLVGFVPIWLFFTHRAEPIARRLLLIGAFVGAAVLAVAPFTWRNYVTSGEFVLVTTTGGRNLLKGNGPGANGSHVELMASMRGTNLKDYLLGRVDNVNTVHEDREMSAEAWRVMSEDPVRTLGLFYTKLRLFFFARELGIRDQYEFMRGRTRLLSFPWPGFGLIAPLGLAGLLFFARRNRATSLLLVVLATQVASFVLVFVLGRYRVVAVAVLLPFAAAFALDLLRRIRAREGRPVALRLGALALATLVVHLPVAGFDHPDPVGWHHEFLGDRAMMRGKTRLALEHYGRALDAYWPSAARRNSFEIRRKTGDCFASMGRKPEARRIWREIADEIEALYGRSAIETAEGLRRRARELR